MSAAAGTGLDHLEAYQSVMRFAARYGPAALRLAMHAAMPQVLRPELLHQLRINFVAESLGDLAVEADVLFAPFCVELGNGYYQFDPAARLILLQELDPTCEDSLGLRSRRLSEFLTVYIDAELKTARALDPLYRDYLEVEAWVALGFLDPDAAAEQLAAAIASDLSATRTAARLQIGGIAGALTIPLAHRVDVVTYAEALDALDCGHIEQGQRLFEAVGEAELQVGAVTLPPPSKTLKERGVQPPVLIQPVVDAGVNEPESEVAVADSPSSDLAADARESVLPATVLISCARENLPLAERMVKSFVPDPRLGEVEVLAPTGGTRRLAAMSDRALILIQLISASWPAGFRRRLLGASSAARAGIDATLEDALTRRIPVLPVLLGGIDMPAASAFPESLRSLAERHAVSLRDESWQQDLDQIVTSMARLLVPPQQKVASRKPSSIFLACTMRGRPIASMVRRSLQERDIDVWDAESGLRGGEIFAETIGDAIRQSEAVLVVLTEDANDSEWVARELEWATRSDRRIIPLLVGKTEPSGQVGTFVRGWHWLRLPGEFDQETLNRVLDDVAGFLRAEPPPPEQPTENNASTVPSDTSRLPLTALEALANALSSAYRSPTELDALLVPLGRRFDNLTSRHVSLLTNAREIVSAAQREGWSGVLLQALLKDRPNNAEVRALAPDLKPELEALIGFEGHLLSIPLEEFEQRRREVLERLKKSPLPDEAVLFYLSSAAPAQRLLAYCELQVHPEASHLHALLTAWELESHHARDTRETRGLWNLLEAFHQYVYRGSLPVDDRHNVARVATQISDFLDANDDLDPGGQCKKSVSALIRLLIPRA